MSSPSTKQASSGSVIALITIGLGIGWLAGLSVSPVVSIVITSVTGIAAAVVTTLSGVKEEQSGSTSKERNRIPRIEAWPLAVLVLTLIIGSILGIYARNNHLFGSDLDSEIKKWTDLDVPKAAVIEKLFGKTDQYSPYAQPYTQTLQIEIERWTSLGVPREQVVSQLFDQHFAVSKSAQAGPTSAAKQDKGLGTVLFANDASECLSLLAALNMAEATANDALLEKALRDSTITQLHTLPDIIADPAVLKIIVEQVLCANG